MPHLPRQANFHQRKQTRNRGTDSVEKAAIQKIFFANLSCPSQSLREKTVPLPQKLGILNFVQPFEFVHSDWIAADNQPVLLHYNRNRFKPRVLRSVHPKRRAPVSFFVEAQKYIPNGDPYFASLFFYPHGRHDLFEPWRSAAVFLSLNFLAHGHRFWKRVQRRIAQVFAGIAEAVELSHGRLGKEFKSVVEVSRCIRRQPAKI